MAIDTVELQRLNEQYRHLTGQTVRNFVCPITLQDRPGDELCKGHILNQNLLRASRAHVIQYKDIDNRFGKSIEPDLVRWLNLPLAKPEDLIEKAKTLTIKGPNGEKIETFWANKAARAKFQQIDLYRPDGSTFASPFLKNVILQPGQYKQMEIVWNLTLSNASILGSLLKAAYLAMFRMLGYSWVLHPAGDKVRRALAGFWCEKEKKPALEHFREFYRANSMIFNHDGETMQDTLEGGTLLFHYANGDRITGEMFAITVIFSINNRLTTVSLPSYEKEGHYFPAFALYQQFLENRSMPHNVYRVRFDTGQFQIEANPMKLSLAEKPDQCESPQISPAQPEPRVRL